MVGSVSGVTASVSPAAGGTYTYTVTAVNAGGESGTSNSVVVTVTPSAPAPSASTNTSGDNAATVTWTGTSGATSYNVYRSLTPGGEGSTPYATNVTSPYVDSAATVANGNYPNVTYYYTVTALNAGGESAQSSPEVSVNPCDATVQTDVATSLTSTANTGSITLNWVIGSSDDIAIFNVYSSLTTGTEIPGTPIASPNSATFTYTDSSPLGGNTNPTFYEVTEKDACGVESGPSNETSNTAL
jgi:hypothetical protein